MNDIVRRKLTGVIFIWNEDELKNIDKKTEGKIPVQFTFDDGVRNSVNSSSSCIELISNLTIIIHQVGDK
ncbi:UNVERIFIED_CONTAM: hypothetical protein NCL1_13427 [Trichonephila clavipes]